MKPIRDWNGRQILAARSKGGTLAVRDPMDNLLRAGVDPWPPPEIIQKLSESRKLENYFPDDQTRLREALGFYSDLHSVNSEDAITWSVFGPLAYGTESERAQFAEWILRRVGGPEERVQKAHFWLWRRIVHPQGLSAGGPELDFGIATNSTVIVGEAKWNAGVGGGQGFDGESSQIGLRREVVVKYGRRLFPFAKHFVLLAISRDGRVVPEEEQAFLDWDFRIRNMDWQALISCPHHPAHAELERYLEWKRLLNSPEVRKYGPAEWR